MNFTTNQKTAPTKLNANTAAPQPTPEKHDASPDNQKGEMEQSAAIEEEEEESDGNSGMWL